jgi:hypothetical protein
MHSETPILWYSILSFGMCMHLLLGPGHVHIIMVLYFNTLCLPSFTLSWNLHFIFLVLTMEVWLILHISKKIYIYRLAVDLIGTDGRFEFIDSN